MPHHKKWIQNAVKHPGALHRQLGIAEGVKIPVVLLRWASKQPGKLGQRARYALNVRKVNKAAEKKRMSRALKYTRAGKSRSRKHRQGRK